MCVCVWDAKKHTLDGCGYGVRLNLMRKWEHFEHAADMGVRGYGDTVAEAFAEAALALTAVITNPATVQSRLNVAIQCQAPDIELLLVDWLNALIYEMATRHMLFSRFDVVVADFSLTATVWGEVVDVARHAPAVEVKGATYTALRVAQEPTGQWCAQCVVDV